MPPRIALALILSVLAAEVARAGECIDWTDESCTACVRDLVEHAKNLEQLEKLTDQQQPPAELKGTPCAKQAGSWYCFPSVCLVDPAIKALVELDKNKTLSPRAAAILGALHPYRSCGKQHVPALETMLSHYPSATPGFQKAARSVLRNLSTDGKGFADFVRPCVKFLRRRLKSARGELEAAMWVGHTRTAIWEPEPVLKELRALTQVRTYAESDFPLPGCLKTYFGVEQQGLLRLVSPEFLRRLRNAVFARHGRKFKSPDLQQFFRSQPWYKPRDDFSKKMLNRGDRINIRLITAEEQRRKKFPD